RVDGAVEVHLVTGRAELRRLLAVEGLEERVAMRPRVERKELVVHGAENRIRARCKLMERRIRDLEVTLSHRALHPRDGMTGGARQAGLRFRRVDLILDGTIEAPVEEHGVVVTAGAPLGGARADDILHVFDGFAIPLVVERREVMGRRMPLIVDVAMAAPAGLARQEELGGEDAPTVGVGGRTRERARHAARPRPRARWR